MEPAKRPAQWIETNLNPDNAGKFQSTGNRHNTFFQDGNSIRNKD